MSSMHGEGRHRHTDPTHRKGEEAASKSIHIKHPGLLHKEMHVKPGHKISTGAIEKDKAKAEKSGNSAEVKRDVFALNARKWSHK